MASANPTSIPPSTPIRIRLRYGDLDTFVEKFAPNVTRGGVFLPSRNIQLVGAVVGFEIQLASGESVLAGQGRVSWVKEYNAAEPNRPYGMGVQFVSIDPASKPVLARILRAKDAQGQGRRLTTEPLVPLGVSNSAANGSGPLRPGGGGLSGGLHGKVAAPPVDTTVDLVAEYGLDDQTVRRLIERTWMTGARTSDDLADLLKPEPVESATLAQALAELPRLLDPQYSRRRTSGAFRPLDARAASGNSPALPANGLGSAGVSHATPEEVATGGDDTGPDDLDENATTDLTDHETTDMTGDGAALAASVDDVTAPASARPMNGAGKRKRRR